MRASPKPTALLDQTPTHESVLCSRRPRRKRCLREGQCPEPGHNLQKDIALAAKAQIACSCQQNFQGKLIVIQRYLAVAS